MLNGIFGSGKDLHAAAWQAVKVIDRSEETQEDGLSFSESVRDSRMS
jgi:hypothetical protein